MDVNKKNELVSSSISTVCLRHGKYKSNDKYSVYYLNSFQHTVVLSQLAIHPT